MFEAGRIATMINGNFAIAGIKANAPTIEIAVAPVPVKDRRPDPPVTWGVTDTLVICKNAPAEAGKKFIAHIFSTDVRNEFDIAEGMLPVLMSQADNPAFTGEPTSRPSSTCCRPASSIRCTRNTRRCRNW